MCNSIGLLGTTISISLRVLESGLKVNICPGFINYCIGCYLPNKFKNGQINDRQIATTKEGR